MNIHDHPWEKIYRREGRVFPDPFPTFDQVLQEFLDRKCINILDLGCGNGRHVIHLVRAGFKVLGSDISITGLKLTREWLEQEGLEASTIWSDMRHPLPFKESSITGVLSTQVIHHALLSEIRTTIHEIHRVLTPGGLAFVTVSGKKHDDQEYLEIEPGTFLPMTGTEKGLPHHIFTEDELRFEFRSFDIKDISQRAEGKVLAVLAEKK
jgi:SAM-dependent methyltransferase